LSSTYVDGTYHWLQRPNAEEHRNQHDDSSKHVSKIRPPHASRHNQRRIAHLLRDVDYTIGTEIAVHDIDLTSQICHAHIIPSTLVREARENLVSWIVVTKNPEWDENDEETCDMAEETCDLQLWKDR
jgi:hypothetical protein